MITSTDNVASTMPAGWASLGALNNGLNLRTTLFWRRAVGGDTAPTVTHASGSYIVADIVGYSGCISTESPIDAAGTWRSDPQGSAVKADAITTATNNAMVLFFGGSDFQVTFSNYSGSPTPTERMDTPDTASYPAQCAAEFVLATAGTTGARQCDPSDVDWEKNGILIALKPGA